MTSEPVWILRHNYRALPTCDHEVIADDDSCENFNCSQLCSNDKFVQTTFTNGKELLEKESDASNKNNEHNARRLATVERANGIRNMAASHNDTRIVINLSGMRYETYESTLARLPDSLLGSPIKRAPYYRFTSNEFYFNRNRDVFDFILFYYQSGATEGGILVKPDGILEETFVAEVKFFELGEDAERKIGLEACAERKLHDDFEVVSLGATSHCQACSLKIGNVFEPDRRHKSSPLNRLIDVWTIFITVFFVVLLCGKTLPSVRAALTLDQCCNQTDLEASPKKRQISFFWSFSEKACIAWFTLEYVLRALSATHKTTYLFSAQGVFDMLSFLPYLIQIVLQESVSDTEAIVLQRILVFLTFFMVFKLTRYSVGLQILLKTIQTSIKELVLLVVCVVISLILFSSVVYYCESDDQSTKFTSIPATFWFIIVTMTTVGYGEMTPTTVAGKIFSALCAVFGVCCVLAIPSTIIVTNFNFFYLKHKRTPKRPKRPKNRMNGLQKWVAWFRTVAP